MKKPIHILCSLLLAGVLWGCAEENKKTTTMEITNHLTPEEIALGRLTPEVLWKMLRVGEAQLSPDGKTVLYTITGYDMAANKGRTQIYTLPIEGGTPTPLTDGAWSENSPSWSRDGATIYFISARGEEAPSQLWSISAQGKGLKQITQMEDGIEGYGVSPSGDNLFYIQRVKVTKQSSADYYSDLPESKAKIYDDLMVRHWNRWNDGTYLHIFTASLKEGTVSQGADIMEGEAWDAPMSPYFDVAEISWNHAGTAIAYTCKKLAGKAYAVSTDSDIYLYDLATKTTRNLTRNLNEGMVGYDKYPVFSPDDSQIAFTSMERPGNESDKERLFVVDLKTGNSRDLTAAFDYSSANLTWNGNDQIYFISPIRGTYQLCRVSTSGTPVEVVTQGAHDINAITFAAGKMVAERTEIAAPTELFDVNLTDGSMKQLTNTNPEVYQHIKMGEVRERWVRTTDGKEMLVWVILPPDFDPAQKYPTLLYCQGGPQSTVSQRWNYRWNYQVMAAQGYIVVAPNRRGVPSFGQEWLDQISGDYSGQNIQDYLSAIDDVAREPWADETRMGCVGASYGGYSAYYLAGHHNKRFKAFIAHCGMFNFESQYGETEELFFVNRDLGGPYWSEDPVAKRSYANSPHKFVQNWDTPILILVGLNDFRIPYTESLQAFTAAQLRGVPSRLVAFENEAHQVFKPQNSLVWQREFFGWLDKYVKNPKHE